MFHPIEGPPPPKIKFYLLLETDIVENKPKSPNFIKLDKDIVFKYYFAVAIGRIGKSRRAEQNWKYLPNFKLIITT